MRTARQRAGVGDLLNFDSLFDVVTNLAGALIIIVVLFAIGSHPKATAKHADDTRAQAEAQALSDKVEDAEAATRKLTAEWDGARMKLARMNARLRSSEPVIENAQGADRRRKDLAEQVARLKTELDKANAELLKPLEPPSDARVFKVRPPKLRADATLVPVVLELAGRRIAWIDMQGMIQDALSRMQAATWSDSGGTDPTPIAIGSGEFGYRLDLFWKAVKASEGKDYDLVIVPLKGRRGQDVTQAMGNRSEILAVLNRADHRKTTHFVMVFVHPDSFACYYELRDFLISQGWEVGWQPHTEQAYAIRAARKGEGFRPQ
jgi:hypothetical protein